MQAAAVEELAEQEIFFSAQRGDSEAVEYLLKKYKKVVLSCANHYYLPGAEKEDLIQEGMITLYQAILDYDHEHPFPVFARTCVKRKMITAVNSYNKQKHTILTNAFSLGKPIYEDEVETYIDRIPDKNTDPCDLVVAKAEREETLKRVQKTFSHFEKQVFEHFVNGLRYKEIANVLGVGAKSVDNALQRIREKFGRCFSGQRNC
jgi:RNA polymerase sporulation-specific sigma factor